MNYQKMMEQMMQQQNAARQQPANPLAGIDINSAKDLSCDNCSSMKFQITFLLKKISAIVSPTGEDITIPIQTFSCQKCGWINKEFVQPGDSSNDE